MNIKYLWVGLSIVLFSLSAPADILKPLACPEDNNRQIRSRLEMIADLLKQEEKMAMAVDLLQENIVEKEDKFFKDDGGNWKSAQFEALNQLKSLSKDALAYYESRYGERAMNQYQKARDDGNRNLLFEIAYRYMYTKAGAKAANMCGTHYLDRGHERLALIYFESLLDRRNFEPNPLFFLKMALSYHRIGDSANAKKMWERFVEIQKDSPYEFNGKNYTLKEVQESLFRKVDGDPSDKFQFIPREPFFLYRESLIMDGAYPCQGRGPCLCAPVQCNEQDPFYKNGIRIEGRCELFDFSGALLAQAILPSSVLKLKGACDDDRCLKLRNSTDPKFKACRKIDIRKSYDSFPWGEHPCIKLDEKK